MFTFIEMAEERGGRWDSANNAIEGGVGSQIRLMLHNHRGLTTLCRARAVFWWCYPRSEFKVSEAEMLKVLPTDEEVEGLFALVPKRKEREDGCPDEYGDAVPEWGKMKMGGSKDTGWF